MSSHIATDRGMDRRALLVGGVAAGALLVAAGTDAAPASATTTGSPIWYNAELYSTPVKRNGTPTNNTANFNSMVAAVSQSGGGVIYFPGGRDADPTGNSLYKFNGVLRMKSNVVIRGDGFSVTQFIWIDDTVADGYIVYFEAANNAGICDIGFNAGASQSGSNAVSIKVNNSRGVAIERCRFTSLRRAIDIYNGSSRVWVRNNTFQNSTVGLGVSVMPQEGDAPSDIEISNNTFDGIVRDTGNRDLTPLTAIFSQGTRVHVHHNSIANSDDTGIMFGSGTADSSAIANVVYSQLVSIFVGNGALRTRIIGNSLHSESDHGIHAYNRDGFPNSAYTVIESNSLSNCGKTGIHIEGADGVSCVGNTILNPGRRDLPASADPQRSGILVSNNASLVGDVYTGPPTNFARNCNISSNTVIDENDSSPVMRYGIHIGNASIGGMVISGNTVSKARIEKIKYPATKPAPDLVPAGTQWWAGTKPVWSNGSAWVDATGTVVP